VIRNIVFRFHSQLHFFNVCCSSTINFLSDLPFILNAKSSVFDSFTKHALPQFKISSVSDSFEPYRDLAFYVIHGLQSTNLHIFFNSAKGFKKCLMQVE